MLPKAAKTPPYLVYKLSKDAVDANAYREEPNTGRRGKMEKGEHNLFGQATSRLARKGTTRRRMRSSISSARK